MRERDRERQREREREAGRQAGRQADERAIFERPVKPTVTQAKQRRPQIKTHPDSSGGVPKAIPKSESQKRSKHHYSVGNRQQAER